MNFIRVTLCALLINAPILFAGESWSISQLLSEFSAHDQFQYNYTEIKQVNILLDPMKTRGVLSFKSPNVLQKTVTYPKKDSYKIIGDRLIINRQNKPQREVLLTNYPELLALAESLRATFNGKEKLLKKYYTLELKGNRQNWTLTLTPIDIDLVEKIEFIEIQGQNGQLKRVVIQEVNGDKSVLTVAKS